MTALTITDLNNAKLDLDHWAEVATSLNPTATDRLGHVKQTIAAASNAIAQTAAGQATTARIAAEAARDAANAVGKVFTTTALGIAGTTSGQSFSVLSADLQDIIVYTNPSTTEVFRLKTKAFFDAVFVSITPIGYAWSVIDAAGNAAIGVKDDGTFSAFSAEFANLLVTALTVQDITATTFNTPNSQIKDQLGHIGFVYTIDDANGNAALGVKSDGTVVVNALETQSLAVSTINGLPYVAAATQVGRSGGRYSHQINFVNTTGQSLSEGSSPSTTLTSVQEYDNIGFPAHSSAPAATVLLTVANTQVSGRGESPMYGTAGHIKALIAAENGLAFAGNDYQLLSCNNGYSGYSITQLNKGTAPYAAAISQVQAGYTLAVASGKTFSHQANTWTQGESDGAMTQTQYRDLLLQLAEDYNTDSRAITGQFNDVVMITYQVGSGQRPVALAQLEASELSNTIFMACPMYQFDYYNAQHIDATNAKWLGGYYGLAYKRIVIDGIMWQPLKPISHAISGNTIDLFFNKQGLTLDTTLVPAQVNYGFTVRDAGGATIAINSVAVVAPSRVRITCASAPVAGWNVDYGLAAAVGKGPYVGGCGNLRDKQGDSIVYASVGKPMHNWSVLFQYTL